LITVSIRLFADRGKWGVVLMRSTANRGRLGLALLVLALAGALLASVALARPGPKRPARAQVVRINFVDLRKNAGPPSGTTCTNDFRLIHGGVTLGSSTVHYTIDTSGSGLGGSAATAVQTSFDTWHAADSASPTVSGGGGGNTISWAPLSGSVVASTGLSINPPTKTILSFDMVFNSNLDWSASGEAGKFDVQDVATHEAGHVYGLDHVNSPKEAAMTMYPFVSPGETLKRTLCDGDSLGLNTLYP
jgi:Matrixin